jgi:hypothetical protein
MTTMPTIDDRMVVLLRRTGKRRSSYRPGGSGGSGGRGARVVPQFNECRGRKDGERCGQLPGMVCCSEICTFGPC